MTSLDLASAIVQVIDAVCALRLYSHHVGHYGDLYIDGCEIIIVSPSETITRLSNFNARNLPICVRVSLSRAQELLDGDRS